MGPSYMRERERERERERGREREREGEERERVYVCTYAHFTVDKYLLFSFFMFVNMTSLY